MGDARENVRRSESEIWRRDGEDLQRTRTHARTHARITASVNTLVFASADP